jgi:hypothetical protein
MRSFALILLGLMAAPVWASEPVVAFRVEEGWVRFAVTRDDQPVRDVTLRVVDRPGAPFVEGEADEQGVGSFPAPASADCVVTFTLAGQEADPMLIQFADKKSRVEPERVLLTFGRRPCCSVTRLKPDDSLAGGWRWLWAAELAVGVACLTGVLWLIWRPRSVA